MTMGSLATLKSVDVGRVPDGLSERLQWLRKFGQPRLSMPGKGWYASIDMNTNTTGSKFTVSSEFEIATPDEAVAMLIERMLGALAKLATPGQPMTDSERAAGFGSIDA